MRSISGRWLRIVVAVLSTVLAVTTIGGIGDRPTDSRDNPCRTFDGRTIDAASWSAGGDFLGVAMTSPGDGTGSLVVLGWPSMTIVSEASGVSPFLDAVAIDDEGAVYWLTSDPMSASPIVENTLWRVTVGGRPEALGVLLGNYVSIQWGGGLIGHRLEDGEPGQVVRVDVNELGAPPTELVPWTSRTTEEWIDRTGHWSVRSEQDEPGARQDVVVSDGVDSETVSLPGYGGGMASLTPDHASVIYQRSETARLTVMDIATGEIRGELDDRTFYGGEISSNGILAAPTAHGPGEPNQLCVLDVNARLAALAAHPERRSPPALPAEDLGLRAAFVAATRSTPPGAPMRLRAVLPGDWLVLNFFKTSADNYTALNALGFDFDVESAAESLDRAPGVVVTLSNHTQVTGWFALPTDLIDASRHAGGGVGVSECLAVSRVDGIPAFVGFADC